MFDLSVLGVAVAGFFLALFGVYFIFHAIISALNLGPAIFKEKWNPLAEEYWSKPSNRIIGGLMGLFFVWVGLSMIDSAKFVAAQDCSSWSVCDLPYSN